VRYTLTLTNRSTAAMRDIVLLDQLSAELQPGAIISGAGAAWQRNELRVALADLAPGAQVEIVFTATVAPGTPAGKIIVNQARVGAAGIAALTASASIAMPPAELPRVGRGADSRR
jgi:hypothetical protein